MRAIDECLSELAESFPRLADVPASLTDEELLDVIGEAVLDVGRGLPVSIPEDLADQGETLRSAPSWRRLMELLQEWNESLEDPSLSQGELEYLALGMLWQNLLIAEYRKRRLERGGLFWPLLA